MELNESEEMDVTLELLPPFFTRKVPLKSLVDKEVHWHSLLQVVTEKSKKVKIIFFQSK